MMDASQSVVELVDAARAEAKVIEERISEIQILNDGTDAPAQELRAATIALEASAVDTFSAFEARMQHHFKRGPFSRKLKALLLEEGQADLADRVHQYYLAINVLKHGTGASFRELRDLRKCRVTLRPRAELDEDDTEQQVGLVDVTIPGFSTGLTTTILEAYDFLERKTGA